MKTLREYKDEPDNLADFIRWSAIVAPGIVLNKNGSFQTTFRYRGPDLESATKSELLTATARMNNLLRALKGGWAMYSEATRVQSTEYPAAQWENPIAHLIDEERRISFESGKYYESEYYLTFIWLPPEDLNSKVESLFYENTQKYDSVTNAKDHLQYFKNQTAHILDMLKSIFPEIHALDDEETLTYLHKTISNKKHTVLVPDEPVELDYLLTDTPLTGGFSPKLGDQYIGVITVKDFPYKGIPGMLDQLNHNVGFSYRWVTRYIFFDRTAGEAELNKIKRQLFSGRKSLMTLIKEMVTQGSSVMENTDAVNKAMDADVAIQELASDAVNFGYITQSIVIMDKDNKKLRDKCDEIERILNSIGLVTVNEVENRNCLDAWLGSIPGCCGHNVRHPIVSTLNLTHIFPLSAVWAGPKENAHLSEVYSRSSGETYTAAPHLYAVTNGTVPFRLSLNIGDVGHTMVIGPTGAGKSVLLNMLEVQWLRYPSSQVYIFDKGGSSRVLTAGMGGDFYSLGGEQTSLAFQPLALVDKPSEREWAQGWILDILRQENLEITPDIQEKVWDALEKVAHQQQHQRTLGAFAIFAQDHNIKSAMKPYIDGGPHADLLNSQHDSLNYGRWQVFEMEELMHRKNALIPVLTYLFWRLEQRFNGSPTLLVLDEAWVFLDNPVFQGKIREWLKVLRKKNVYVVFATQSLADIAESRIVATIKESCMSKIFLPNSNALDEDSTRIYKSFGLNNHQIHILAHATAKRDYYYTSPNGNRLFSLGLSKLALAYCAATDKDTQNMVSDLLKNQDLNFNVEYLRHRDIPWAVKFLEEQYRKG